MRSRLPKWAISATSYSVLTPGQLDQEQFSGIYVPRVSHFGCKPLLRVAYLVHHNIIDCEHLLGTGYLDVVKIEIDFY